MSFVDLLIEADIDQSVFSAGNEWLTRLQRSEKVSSFRAIIPIMLGANDRIGITGNGRGFINLHGGKFRLGEKTRGRQSDPAAFKIDLSLFIPAVKFAGRGL